MVSEPFWFGMDFDHSELDFLFIRNFNIGTSVALHDCSHKGKPFMVSCCHILESRARIIGH